MYRSGTLTADDIKLPGIDYLESLIPLEKGDKFTLEAITRFLKVLGDPQNETPSIIVTGTNGKGSVSASISSILGAAGFRVGLNISPHLSNINERILIDGLPVSLETISDAAMIVKTVAETTNNILSFHEAITVISFIVFANSNLDYCVLEVGLGGRLDAANTVSSPVVSVVVSIDLDHQAILGDTLEKIAYEKAGIFREKGIGIIGPMKPNIEKFFKDYCKENAIKSISYAADFRVLESNNNDTAIYEEADGKQIKFKPSLKGRHQIQNMSVAIAAARALGVDNRHCVYGVENVFWPARLESISYKGSEILMDCAHNPAGIQTLISYLESRDLNGFHIGFGAIVTKDWKQMIDMIQPYVDSWSLLEPRSHMSVKTSDIAEYLSLKGHTAAIYGDNYESFLNSLAGFGSKKQLILGSIYLVGAIRGLMHLETKPIWTRNDEKSNH